LSRLWRGEQFSPARGAGEFATEQGGKLAQVARADLLDVIDRFR
jgi:hypothetical protein